MGYHKIATDKPSMGWSESVDEALCFFGDIDGIRKRINDASYTLNLVKPSHKKTVHQWVCSAKKPETRMRRFTALLEACAAGQRLR